LFYLTKRNRESYSVFLYNYNHSFGPPSSFCFSLVDEDDVGCLLSTLLSNSCSGTLIIGVLSFPSSLLFGGESEIKE
jgi:hypothetical protein